MARHILFCAVCKEYTICETCPECKNKAYHVRPPKYSPDDRYAEMRRKLKEEEYKSRGLL
ncbi:MAG: nucleolar RNA-binding Nop10p family protein [Candidatus Woesearchaeota archaeon]